MGTHLHEALGLVQDGDSTDRDSVEHGERGPEKEEQEVAHVAPANAVVEERTVVVHLHDTRLADAAVVRVGRLVQLAPARVCLQVTHTPRPSTHEQASLVVRAGRITLR
jgi:hypothetical protein